MSRIITRRKSTVQKDADDVHRAITRRKISRPNARVEFISSNCIPLNLALSQRGLDGGWARGRVINIVGDGSSGKTLLALEAAFSYFNNIQQIQSLLFPKVKKFIIKYDNAEGVMDMPIEEMYGEEFVDTVDWTRSLSFEAMCRRFLKTAFKLKRGESLLYIVDSWDSFQGAKSKKDFKESIEKDTDLKGDYDLHIQKYASRKFFPAFCDALDHNKIDATLIVISQVRAKIGVTFGKKQYRAGGKALDFYTHQVAWIAEIKKLVKTKLGGKRVYSIRSRAKIERSKVAKPFREAEFTILYDYGMDNVNSMIDFLWGVNDEINAKWKGEKFKKRNTFVRFVEKNNLEEALAKKVTKKWMEIENAFKKEVQKRKRRY